MQRKTAMQHEDIARGDRTKLLACFLDKVQITKACWLWLGYLSEKGYGCFWSGGKYIRAHRFSYEFFIGPIESGKMILHRRECGNPSCVNPNHLYMGTVADNMRDTVLWGKSPGRAGEDHPNAKLSKDDVLDIRKRAKEGMLYKDIATMFNVSKGCIGKIIAGESWKGKEYKSYG